MNQASLSYVAFGALVVGGVPLRDLPEIAEPEVAAEDEKIEAERPAVEEVLKPHGLIWAWFHHPVAIH